MIYVVDANAMIAVFNDEDGADVIEDRLTQPNVTAYAHAINVCEVFYNLLRGGTEAEAQDGLAMIRDLGIAIHAGMSEAFWQDAGRIKVAHRLSLADAFAVALARSLNGTLLTSDHHELEPLAKKGVCKIQFFR